MKEVCAEVISNREIHRDFYVISMKTGGMKAKMVPGQFAMIGGDFGDGLLLRRPYSIFDATSNGKVTTFRFFYKVVGKGTARLSRAGKGDNLSVLAPLGRGFDYSCAADKTIVIVMGGIGVAPFYLFMKHIKKYNPKRVVLFYGARNKQELFFTEFFKRHADRVHFSTDDGSRGYKGFVSSLLAEKLDSPEFKAVLSRETVAFTCGPRSMMREVSLISRKRQIACYASMEEIMGCGMGACLSCVVRSADENSNLTVCHDGPVFRSDEIVI